MTRFIVFAFAIVGLFCFSLIMHETTHLITASNPHELSIGFKETTYGMSIARVTYDSPQNPIPLEILGYSVQIVVFLGGILLFYLLEKGELSRKRQGFFLNKGVVK